MVLIWWVDHVWTFSPFRDMRFLYILWLSFFWHLIFRTLMWYSCRWEMRYMIGDRSYYLDIFFVSLSFQKDAKWNVQIEGMNEYLIFIPVMMMFKFRATIKCPGKMPQQIELHVVTDGCHILCQYFAKRSIRGFVDVKISYQNKILTDMIRCVSRPKTECYVTCFRL